MCFAGLFSRFVNMTRYSDNIRVLLTAEKERALEHSTEGQRAWVYYLERGRLRTMAAEGGYIARLGTVL